MSTLALHYDPDGTVSYGYYRCPDCGSAFYGGGPALHKKGCDRAGYEGLDYYLGDKALSAILDGSDRLNPVSADDVRRQLPDIAERLSRSEHPVIDGPNQPDEPLAPLDE